MESYTDPLHALADRLKPKRVLEIGLGYEGYSTQVWLHHGATVTTIDKSDWTGKGAQLSEMNPKKFTFIIGRSEQVMPTLKGKFDFIYIDGDHRYDGAKKDMENAIKLLAPKGVIVLDDYGVTTADAVDLDDNGQVINGAYGVKQAANEVFKLPKWKWAHSDIELANGGRAYART
jgi:predicted O-methyltransferase YrrM